MPPINRSAALMHAALEPTMIRPAQLVLSLAFVAGATALPAAELSYAGGTGSARRVAREPELQMGYTDLRLGFFTMPTKGASNESGTDLNNGGRISLAAIGPVCGIIPINCYTPTRPTGPGNAGPGAISWADRDGWNWLGGLELSTNYWMLNRDYGSVPAVPKIEHTALAVTFHAFQLGFQVPCRCSGRAQYEFGPFLGLGTSTVKYTGAYTSALDDSSTGLYLEGGLRFGLYYTWSFGLQIGAEARYTATSSQATSSKIMLANVNGNSVLVGPGTVEMDTRGMNAGLLIGWRL